jgi:hypothetical protein
MRMVGLACGVVLLVGAGASADRIVRLRDPSHARGTPVGVVETVLESFRDRSAAYTHWMTPDYEFDSDDPEFQASFPNGMSIDDERAYARHLFRDEATANDFPLPWATHVEVAVESIDELPAGGDTLSARVLLHIQDVAITLSDGSVLDVSDTYDLILLAPTEQGWRIRRWREFMEPTSLQAALADTTADSAAAVAPSSDAAPLRLAIVPRTDRGAWSFDVELPADGGTIEIFDVMGRRLVRQNLMGLSAGRHTVTLDGASHPPGVYFARLEQARAAANAKVVWVH